jgi:hypothetical protein
LEPGATFEVVLDSDMDKPEAERPTFVFRSLSVREWKGVKAKSKEESDTPFLDAALAGVKAGLTDWRNMVRDGRPVPFSHDELEAIVDEQEIVELLNKLRFSERDKKKLELPHTFGPVNSAPAAEAASA